MTVVPSPVALAPVARVVELVDPRTHYTALPKWRMMRVGREVYGSMGVSRDGEVVVTAAQSV